MGTPARAETRLWWRVFALVMLVCVAWTLTLPLTSGPDESMHVVRAAAVARGQLFYEARDDANLFVKVRVPEAYTHDNAFCFQGVPREHLLPATVVQRGTDCGAMRGSRAVDAGTYEYRGQPFYYFLVGLPTLFTASDLGGHLMRLAGALMSSALLASGIVSLLRLPGRRLALLGAAAAITPAVIYLSSTVNSAGLEVASGFCLWATGLAVVRGADEPDRRLVNRMGLALVIFSLSRGLSPVMAVMVLGVLALLAGRERLAALWRRRDVRVWLGAGGAAIALSVAWLAYIHVQFPLSDRHGSGLSHALSKLSWWPREMVGTFGPTDVVPPVALHLLWLAGILTLVGLGWRQGARLEVLLGGLLGVSGLALLVSGEGFSFPQTGFWWQGRYVLPLMIGAVLVAAVGPRSGTPAEPARTPWAFGLVALFLACHMWAYGYVLRHYTVGHEGTRNPFRFVFHPVWSPPLLPPVVLVLLVAGGAAALVAVVTRAAAAWSVDTAPASNPGLEPTRESLVKA